MELIKIETNEQGRKVVSARELYLGLGLNKAHWKRWSEQNIIQNGFFKENIDWVGFNIVVYGNETKDFAISLEFATYLINSAKHISSKKKIDVLRMLGCDNRIDLYSRKEVEFLDLLERVLEPFGYSCKRQHGVLGKYRIDLYIDDLNVAIEYDENNHDNYAYEQHEGRQKEIEKKLGCKFIRVNDFKSSAYNVGLVMKGIMGE